WLVALEGGEAGDDGVDLLDGEQLVEHHEQVEEAVEHAQAGAFGQAARGGGAESVAVRAAQRLGDRVAVPVPEAARHRAALRGVRGRVLAWSREQIPATVPRPYLGHR